MWAYRFVLFSFDVQHRTKIFVGVLLPKMHVDIALTIAFQKKQNKNKPKTKIKTNKQTKNLKKNQQQQTNFEIVKANHAERNELCLSDSTVPGQIDITFCTYLKNIL